MFGKFIICRFPILTNTDKTIFTVALQSKLFQSKESQTFFNLARNDDKFEESC